MTETKFNSVAAVLAVALVLAAGNARADIPDQPGMEKCLGIAKIGKNDCAANEHTCAGHGNIPGDPNEWIYLPKGTCKKIVGSRGVRSW